MDEMTTGKKPSTIRLFRVFIEKKTMSLIVNPYDMYGFTVEFKIRENNEFHVVYVTDRRTEKLDQTRYEATVKNGDVIVEYHHTMKWFLNKIPEAIENFHVLIKGSVSEEIRVALYPKMAESFGGDGAKLPRVKKFTMDYSGKVNDEQDVLGFLPYVEMVEEKQLVFRQEDDFGGRNELRLQEVFKTPQWKAARELTLENKFWCNFHNECWWQFERAVLDCKTLRRIDVQAFIEVSGGDRNSEILIAGATFVFLSQRKNFSIIFSIFISRTIPLNNFLRIRSVIPKKIHYSYFPAHLPHQPPAHRLHHRRVRPDQRRR